MHKNLLRLIVFTLTLTLILGLGESPAPAATAVPWRDKVDPVVLSAAQSGEAEFLVFLETQADLSAAAALGDKTAKATYVYRTLSSLAESTQKPLRRALDSQGVAYKPFWIVNALWVRGDLDLIQQIARRPDVAYLYANPAVKLDTPEPAAAPALPAASNAVEWNVLKINADDVWAAGYRGQGVVVAGADTGYSWSEPAIHDQYRGWNGTSVDHNYNWHDATGDSPDTPVDPYGHGTHTMGTMVGDDGGANQIGVAPGARWIGCRNMDSSGYGTPARYIECYQWFVAPTDLNGNNPRPDLAPDVINNSWGCTVSEGCTDANLDVLLPAVQNVRAAGIVTVHSAGNSGSSCGTVDEPAAMYAESFTVGATDSSDGIASFSSRGPVTRDGSNRMKPDISAPGVGVRSCVPGGGYATWNGTSMAGPHIAGVVALLISAQPNLAGNVDLIEDLIEQSAVPRYTTQGCGDDTPASRPNNVYGWGRVDAWAAYQAISQITHTLSIKKNAPQMALPGDVLTYTLTITHSHPLSATTSVILTDTLPAGTSFAAATGNYTVTGDLVTWGLGDLGPGASASVQLGVDVPLTATGTITNARYGAVSDEAAPVSGVPVTTTVSPYELAIAKQSPAAIMAGDVLTYTLVVTNLQSLGTTHHVILTDTLPAGTSFAAATGNYTVTGDLVTWGLGDLGPGASASVQLGVDVPLTATGTITNARYGAVSDEAAPVRGAPVNTQVYYRFFLPLVLR